MPNTIFIKQARLAQSVEHETLNLRVVGSSPTLGDQLFCLFYSVCKHKSVKNSLVIIFEAKNYKNFLLLSFSLLFYSENAKTGAEPSLDSFIGGASLIAPGNGCSTTDSYYDVGQGWPTI